MLPDRVIITKIIVLRDQKVIVDRDLANLYGVETRVLNQAVKRNIKRFPVDFMFQMTNEELKAWKSQIVMSESDRMGLRKPPYVFTEQGVAMLSSVLIKCGQSNSGKHSNNESIYQIESTSGILMLK